MTSHICANISPPNIIRCLCSKEFLDENCALSNNVLFYPCHFRESKETAFLDEFSDLLLQKLLEAATKGSGDHDKVKSNAVRAVGMLIQYARPQALGEYTQHAGGRGYSIKSN